jgi:hypothetical protein
MPYHTELAAAEKLAQNYGLVVAVPPIARESGWHSPGRNGTHCYAFVRPGTTVKWLPEQSNPAAFAEWEKPMVAKDTDNCLHCLLLRAISTFYHEHPQSEDDDGRLKFIADVVATN